MHFSEPVDLQETALLEGALEIANNTIQSVSPTGTPANQRWGVRIAPANDAAVTITVPETAQCTDAHAICTANGRRLATAVTATVPVESTTRETFQVRFADAADEHDAESDIVFKVSFTKEHQVDYSYRTMRDETLSIVQSGTTHTATEARRVNAPNNDQWELTVTPQGTDDITVSR